LKKKVKLSETQKYKILRQIASAMKILHEKSPHRNPIVHRDLTLFNLLINDQLDCYLADFGIAVEIPHTTSGEKIKQSSDEKIKLSPVGHPGYRAPEVSSNELTSKRCDVYNFGNVMYELLGEVPLFVELDKKEIAKKNIDGNNMPDLKVLSEKNVDKKLIGLLKRCWKVDPKKRPQFVEIVSLF